MSVNKFERHVIVIPEDRADEAIANGFVNHPLVIEARIQVVPPAGGWVRVLEVFQEVYVKRLRTYDREFVVMLIDFDERFPGRKTQFDEAVPIDVKDRVFVLGTADEPETLKKALKLSGESIGSSLAQECSDESGAIWSHEQVSHNDPERQRLQHAVKPFLFVH